LLIGTPLTPLAQQKLLEEAEIYGKILFQFQLQRHSQSEAKLRFEQIHKLIGLTIETGHKFHQGRMNNRNY
jgi:hypothetical protein